MENPDSPSRPGPLRLQVFLRDCGLGSRRDCDALVRSGRARVNGRVITEATVHLSDGDRVEVDGKAFLVGQRLPSHLYLKYHKPPGLLCTHDDELGRLTIFSQLKDAMALAEGRLLFFAGRLDAPSRGLMVLSTDGAFIQELVHPSHGASREYEVRVAQPVSDEVMAGLSRGVVHGGVTYAPFENRRLGPSRFRLTLQEGKKREIRNIFESAGNRVVDLCRIRLGTYTLDGLREGGWERIERD